MDFLLHALGWLVIAFGACFVGAFLLGAAFLAYMLWQEH